MLTIYLIVVFILALSWGAYGLWEYKLRREEKMTPPNQKPKSERLRQAEKTFEEYAKKMAEFKKKPYGGSGKPQ